jgi:hypothetical protein
MDLGSRSVWGMTIDSGGEISPFRGKREGLARRDPHEVRARERFAFPEGPARVHDKKERKPLPPISLSHCLPVNLSLLVR